MEHPIYPVIRGRPLVLGHRGASAAAPENTMAAFAMAMDRGADGFELDVWRCGSGEVVVIHDPDTRRTSGIGARVTGTRLARLRELDVGSWKGPAWRGERIPRLEEVLDAFPGAVVNVEMKAGRVPDLSLARAVAAIVADRRAAGRVVVSSFHASLVAAFRLAAPGIPAAYLVEPGHGWLWRERLVTRALGVSGVHPAAALVTYERLREWHLQGMGVGTWTVDAPAEVERLTRIGIDAVISNEPGLARETVRRVTGA